MTKDDALNQLAQLLWFHFPDERPGKQNPWWGQRNYKIQFFELCKESLHLMSDDDVSQFVRDQWNIQRQHPLSLDDTKRLRDFEDAWKEWRYALHEVQRDTQDRR